MRSLLPLVLLSACCSAQDAPPAGTLTGTLYNCSSSKRLGSDAVKACKVKDATPLKFYHLLSADDNQEYVFVNKTSGSEPDWIQGKVYYQLGDGTITVYGFRDEKRMGEKIFTRKVLN